MLITTNMETKRTVLKCGEKNFETYGKSVKYFLFCFFAGKFTYIYDGSYKVHAIVCNDVLFFRSHNGGEHFIIMYLQPLRFGIKDEIALEYF